MKTFLTISAGIVIGMAIADVLTEGEVHRIVFGAVQNTVKNVPAAE